MKKSITILLLFVTFLTQAQTGGYRAMKSQLTETNAQNRAAIIKPDGTIKPLANSTEGYFMRIISGSPQWGLFPHVTTFSAGNLSPLFSTSVATETTTPVLSFTLTQQNQNLFFASPSGSAGSPSYRSLVYADFPLSGATAGSYTNTSVTVNDRGIVTGISSGTVSTYTLPTATTTVLGGVKIDGTSITINGSGVISAPNVGGGTVVSVGATAPITSTGGNSPTIGINAATQSTAGSLSAADKTKLDGIAAGAEVNVNADWNAVSGDALILNKPTIPVNTDNQTLGTNNTAGNISISGGNTITLNVNDADANPANEYNSSMSWTDATNTVSVTDAGATRSVVITGFLESEVDGVIGNEYNTSMSWNDATNTVSVTDPGATRSTVITGFLESELDGSPSNELQTISVSAGANPTVTLSNSGGSFNLTGSGGTTVSNTSGTITINSTGGSMVYPGVGLALSTGSGWSTSVTNNSANWNTAYTNMGKGTLYGSGTYNDFDNYLFSVSSGHIIPNYTSDIDADNSLPVRSNALYTAFQAKQNVLVSGTNIKTIQNTSLLGSGSFDGNPSVWWHASEYYLGTSWLFTDDSGIFRFRYNSGGYADKMTISTGGNVTATNFILSSDRRLKTDIMPIDLTGIDKIKFKQFTMKDDPARLRYGVIAQQVERVAPELVYTDDKGMKSVAYTDLLVAKIARMEELIKLLEKRIKTIENEK